MALGKITKTAVERLKPGEWLWDADHREVIKGFGARRQIDGVFYYLRYRLNGRQSIKSLGRHGHLTPDTARTKAKEKLGKVATGTDPFAEEAKARAAETFANEVRRYLERKRTAIKPRTYSEVERHLLLYAKPFYRFRLDEIDRRSIAARLSEIEIDRGRVTRNRVRSSLSVFFNWAITEGFIEGNPVVGTAKADEGRSRDRVLTGAELAEVWRASAIEPVGQKPLGQRPIFVPAKRIGLLAPLGQFGEIVRLLIITGQRREEIGGLRWSEVDFDRDLIELPPERTKNKRRHVIPLSPQATAILKRQPQKGRDFVFGYGKGSFSGWSDCKARLDQFVRAARREADPKAEPMSDWRLHDLRRTAATGMAELGVLPHIVEAVLNHVSGHKSGVAGIYNRARYEDEMRAALDLWADHVETLASKRRP